MILSAIAYVCLLFGIAFYGDRQNSSNKTARPYVYGLSIAIYCTSWTYFGSVGLAAERGIEYLAIYVGPVLVFTFGFKFLRRIIQLAKSERITSVADFLGSRYGKNFGVSSLATVIAAVAAVPYIAIQLKAISSSFDLFTSHFGGSLMAGNFVIADFSFLVAASLALFAMLFGTRHADVTEHQNGLILAVAVESVIKLMAFLAAGIGVTFFLFGQPGDLVTSIQASAPAQAALAYRPSLSTWIIVIGLSGFASILLPRQFHVMIVENRNVGELRTAAWLFPLYLILINLFVMPIALTGLTHLPVGSPADLFVLALPLSVGANWLSLLIFIGGLSAATAMVIVATVALSIMISNDLILPLMLRRYVGKERNADENLPATILNVRRAAILCIMLAAYAYYRETAVNFRLASIGLISFAAIAQLAPAFLGGLIWREANSRGAILGMAVGILVWFYTLLFPTLVGAGHPVVVHGLFGLEWLRPQHLFGVEASALTHGVIFSISLNLLFYVLGSFSRLSLPLERIQAAIFVPRDSTPMPSLRRLRTAVTVNDLNATISRYIGAERTERSFQTFEAGEGRVVSRSAPADVSTIRFAEQLLASAVGSSSARLVLSLLFQRNDQSARNAFRLLDDASEALQHNRDLLQIALDQMAQGITVFDKNYQLTCWNRQYRTLFDLPADFGQVGVSLRAILDFLAERNDISRRFEDTAIKRLSQFGVPWQVELLSSNRIIELRSNPMPDGGIVATYTDITARVRADEALKRINESLEQRVELRTSELSRANTELAQAQTLANEANISKTRFLAAAGHDILQPLNAARLYSASLIERLGTSENEKIVSNIESSLESVEAILGAVLDISRLDTGALKPTLTTFSLDALLRQIQTDFSPIAAKKNLKFAVIPTKFYVHSDRNLLARLIQNLVSNAIKYTRVGGVVVGVRRRGAGLDIQVVDSGIGIAQDKARAVFKEFTRLEEGMREAEGLGLGLSIVERIGKVLKLPVSIKSQVNRGTTMSIYIARVQPTGDQNNSRVPPLHSNIVNLPQLRLLCIDNDLRILDGMKTLLSGWSNDVTCVSNGRDALRETKRPDFVLVDYHLDNETGISVIAQLRDKFGENLAAILVTADRSNEVKSLAAAMDIIILNKPLKPAALRAVLARGIIKESAVK